MSELCDHIREFLSLKEMIRAMESQKDSNYVDPIKREGTEEYITEEDAKVYKEKLAARAANRIAVNKRLEPLWKKRNNIREQIMRLLPEVNLWVRVPWTVEGKYYFVRKFVNYQIEVKTGEEMEAKLKEDRRVRELSNEHDSRPL